MRVCLPLPALLVLLSACGPREPGPHPGETTFWRIDTYGLELGQCTDEAELKEKVFDKRYKPIATDGTSYYVLRVSADGREVESVSCTRLGDPSSCQSFSQPLRLSVSGHESFLGSNEAYAIGDTGCSLAIATAWVLVDRGVTLESTVTETYSLVGPQETCAQLDTNVRNASPNGFGLEGCTAVQRMSAQLH